MYHLLDGWPEIIEISESNRQNLQAWKSTMALSSVSSGNLMLGASGFSLMASYTCKHGGMFSMESRGTLGSQVHSTFALGWVKSCNT